MSRKNFFVIFTILILINIVFAGYNYYSKRIYKQKYNDLEFYKVESFSFFNLHEKYKNKKAIKKRIRELKKIGSPVVKNKNSKLYSFEYSKLNTIDANKILNRLLNSSLIIKKFSMKKGMDKSIKIYFEVRG